MDALIGAILSLLANTTNPDNNNQPEKYVTFQEFKENYHQDPTYQSLNEEYKPKHYYAEDILCKLADCTPGEEHLRILDTIGDKYIKISGTVSIVHKYDYMWGCYIEIRQKRADKTVDGWCFFSCEFDDENEYNKVANLKKGDKITLIGHTNYSLWALKMYDCHLK